MIKFDVYELPDTPDGEFKHHVEYREYPEEGKRHSELCVVCGFSTYPECRKWCPNAEGPKRRIIDERKIKGKVCLTEEELEEATVKIEW